jgi:effector-binding domain-containing protein
MPYAITVRTLQPRPAIVIRATLRVEELPAFFGSAYGELYAFAARHAAPADGPPFARYPGITSAAIGPEVSVEAGITLPRAIGGEGRIEAAELPGGECAVTEHIGPYEGMEPAYKALEGWMHENGRTAAGGPWEVYHSDPAHEPDSQRWRTELFWPLK